jgi:hypothetical protein
MAFSIPFSIGLKVGASLFCLWLVGFLTVQAQVLQQEQWKPSLRWHQLHTPHFQLIYPIHYEEQAQQLASDLEKMIDKVSYSMGLKPRKISIILQNQTVESNGFVQLAPRYSQFVTTPPPVGDFQPWLQHLAVHELRHVVQFDAFGRYLKIPMLEQVALALFGITLPAWFFEGDAVLTETLLTSGGRGRIPSWEMPFRANILEGHSYSYDKNYLGSLKDITPGFYELGYMMNTYIRRENPKGLLDTLVKDLARRPLRTRAFSKSLRKYTGATTEVWHDRLVQKLSTQWRLEKEEYQPTAYMPLFEKKRNYTENWWIPTPLQGQRILSLYQSASEPSQLVIQNDSGKSYTLTRLGRQTRPYFHYAANQLVWDEVRRDARYANQTYSVLMHYDLLTHRKRQLTQRTRLFSPTLQPEGEQIAAIEVDPTNTSTLVLLDVANGQALRRYPAPDQLLLQMPAYAPDGKALVMVGVGPLGSALLQLDIVSGKFTYLTGWLQQQLETPKHTGDEIVFKAHYLGKDDLYAIHLQTKALRQLTNATYGAFHPWIDAENRSLYFNTYTSSGYQIARLDWPLQGKPLSSSSLTAQQAWPSFFEPLLAQELSPVLADTSGKRWRSEPYSDWKTIFNFHSLSVSASNFEQLEDLNPGIYMLSDNLLGTVQTRLGVRYLTSQRSLDWTASVNFQKYYPKFAIEYRNRGRNGVARWGTAEDPRLLRLSWRESTVDVRAEIPLTLYRGHVNYHFGLGVATVFTQRYQFSELPPNTRFVDQIRFPMNYVVYANRNWRRGALDLGPRFGQNLQMTYRHFPFPGQQTGSLFSMQALLYFPGWVDNHSTSVRFSYQRGAGVYQGVNDIAMVTGYHLLAPQVVRNTLLINYRWPLAYPDWHLRDLLYVKRLKAGAFVDFQNLGMQKNVLPRVLGAELRADLNLFRFVLPSFDIGVRAGYVPERTGPKRFIAMYTFGYTY